MMNLQILQKKKIAVVGLGVNNRKMSEYFSNHGINFEVIDGWKNPDELIGKLDRFDIIFRTPGLPFLSKAILQANRAGVEISSQTELFFSLCPAKIIGVTGTKGKGTSAALLAKIFTESNQLFFLAGNIGRDPFEFLDELSFEHLVIMELSSFQLQDLEISPHVAVVLNITADHLDHHQTKDEYLRSNGPILSYQNNKDFAILDKRLPDSFKNLGQGKKIFFDPKEASGYKTKLLGKHNLENIAAAVEVAKLFKVNPELIKQAVAAFMPLPHRLSYVRKYNDITYIDDSYSTNPDATMAAIDSFDGNIVLILGGMDKELDQTQLFEKIKNSLKVKGIIVIGQLTKKIIEALHSFSGKILKGAKNMEEILLQVHSVAQGGDFVLLSPGAASFDMFKNATDRGDQFIRAVNQIR